MTDDLALVAELERTLPTVVAQSVPPVTSAREAFAWALPASRALAESRLARLNVDIKLAPMIVVGALRKILPFRVRLAALPDFDLRSLDTLSWHAAATAHAEACYMGVSAAPARLAQLAKQARSWRVLLLQDMTIMITRGFLPAKKHAQLRVQAGYKDLSYLLGALVQVYRGAWPKLSGHSTVSAQELDEAETIVEQLAHAFATRADRFKAIQAANEQRTRNFTLLAEAYDQVRRGLHYLRWNEGDADEIAPSLYRGRGGSRRTVKAEPAGAPHVAGDGIGALVTIQQ